MRILTVVSVTSLAVLAISSWAVADEFDYELRLDYDAQRNSSEFTASVPLLGGGERSVLFSSDQDIDQFRLSGSWYFEGVSESSGPRSRAAFLSRASAFSAGYSRQLEDFAGTQVSFDPSIPPSVVRSDTESDLLNLGLRYVRPESGWYGLASLALSERELGAVGGGSVDQEFGALALGVGKYVGEQTAIDITVTRSRNEFAVNGPRNRFYDTRTALSLTHIGDIGPAWQYGADISWSYSDFDFSDGFLDARFSLYPTRSIAFGVGANDGLKGSLDDPREYEVFGSWFPAERIGLEASYNWLGGNQRPGPDPEIYGLRLRALIRF